MKKPNRAFLWSLLVLLALTIAVGIYMYSSGKIFSSADANYLSANSNESIDYVFKGKYCYGDTLLKNCRDITAPGVFSVYVRSFVIFTRSDTMEDVNMPVWQGSIADGVNDGVSANSRGDADGIVNSQIAFTDPVVYNVPNVVTPPYLFHNVSLGFPVMPSCISPESKNISGYYMGGDITKEFRILCKSDSDTGKGSMSLSISKTSGNSSQASSDTKIYFKQTGSNSWQEYGVTDTEGGFGAYLAPGTYDFKAELNGYVSSVLSAKQISSNTNLADTLTLTQNAPAPTPPLPNSFQFTVRDNLTNKVISKANVTLEVYNKKIRIWQPFASILSDSSGKANIQLTSAYGFSNQWRLKVKATGYKSTQTFTIDSGKCTSNATCKFEVKMKK